MWTPILCAGFNHSGVDMSGFDPMCDLGLITKHDAWPFSHDTGARTALDCASHDPHDPPPREVPK